MTKRPNDPWLGLTEVHSPSCEKDSASLNNNNGHNGKSNAPAKRSDSDLGEITDITGMTKPKEVKSVTSQRTLPIVKNRLVISDKKRVAPVRGTSAGYSPEAIAEATSVNPNGSSSVNIDLDLPKDPLGFMPKLSLVYNSFGSAGNLGWGWALNGSSAIVRQGKTIYYDGTTSRVGTDDHSNTFYLDGIRLICTSSASSVCEYQSEKGSIKATAHFSGNTITSFDVKYPNGSKSFFKQKDKFGFYLTETVDALGHHIYYTYEETNAGPVLTKISYGNNRYVIALTYMDVPNASKAVSLYSRGVKKLMTSC